MVPEAFLALPYLQRGSVTAVDIFSGCMALGGACVQNDAQMTWLLALCHTAGQRYGATHGIIV